MTMKRLLTATLGLLAVLVTVGLVAHPAHATFTAVADTADSYTNPSAPTSNFGHSYSLAIGGSPHYVTYIRFTLPADASTATLSLSVNAQTFAGSGSTFQVSTAGDGWTETGLTKNDAPALGAQLAAFHGAVRGASISVPLGDVSVWAGQPLTLALSAASGTDDLWLWSREATTLSKRPSLSVTTTTTTGGSGPLVGVLGDSISQGCCSETTGTVAEPYWMVTANALGWQMPVVDAVGGSGYVNPGNGQPYTSRIGPFLDAHPDLQALIIEGGGNDGGISEATERAAADLVFDTIQVKAPAARVYVLGPYSSDGDPTYATGQRAAISASATAHGFAYIDQVTEGWMTGRSDLLYHDHFHPIEGGHQLLGERLAGDLAIMSCHGCLP